MSLSCVTVSVSVNKPHWGSSWVWDITAKRDGSALHDYPDSASDRSKVFDDRPRLLLLYLSEITKVLHKFFSFFFIHTRSPDRPFSSNARWTEPELERVCYLRATADSVHLPAILVLVLSRADPTVQSLLRKHTVADKGQLRMRQHYVTSPRWLRPLWPTSSREGDKRNCPSRTNSSFFLNQSSNFIPTKEITFREFCDSAIVEYAH